MRSAFDLKVPVSRADCVVYSTSTHLSFADCRKLELPSDVTAELDTLLDAANKASFQQVMLAPMCPKEKVLNHRAAVGAGHPCEHFRGRWNRILLNCSLTNEQQVRLWSRSWTSSASACASPASAMRARSAGSTSSKLTAVQHRPSAHR